MKEFTDRVKYLENEIRTQAYNYYNGNQQITDEEFDKLVDELRELAPYNPVLDSTGWGASFDHSAIEHLTRLHGLPKKKVNSSNSLGLDHVIITPKLDGGSVELIYYKGDLVRAITRGNGITGRDVTSKLRHAQGVPNKLSVAYTGNVVGEYCLSEEDIKELGLDDNQRNIPNGFLNRKDFSIDEAKHFSFIAYRITAIGLFDETPKTRVGVLNYLRYIGDFIVVPAVYLKDELSKPFSQLIEELKHIDGKTYLLDGLVADDRSITSTDNSEGMYNYISYNDSKAYKAITETTVTEVVDIDWNLTRTGRLVPTLVLNPVQLSGATISRVTANNASYIFKNNIVKGTSIKVVRSGEVIPYILEVYSSKDVIVDNPTKCPCCNSDLEFNGTDLKCANQDCNGKSYNKLSRCITTLADVKGLGKSGINSIIELSGANELSDLFTTEDISDNLNKYARLSYSILRDKPDATPTQLFYSANVIGMGYSSIYEFVTNNGIIKDDFYDKGKLCDKIENSNLSNQKKHELLKAVPEVLSIVPYLNLVNETVTDEDNSYKINVCITGSLNSCKKSEFYDKYKSQIAESSVKDCDFLIANSDKGSSKYKKALELGKVIITEEEFIKNYLS